LGEVVSEQEYDFGGNAHGPDVSFFGPDKEKLCEERRRVQRFVPDLAIEIVSENDTFQEAGQEGGSLSKMRNERSVDYRSRFRTAFLYSDASNTILRENGIFQSSLIPGFSIRLGDLFDQL
jgi:hypothetical protein